MPIIDEAKKFLKEEGNPQWQSGYPDVETITTDIDDGVAWVLIVDQKIAGYTAITDGPDPNYKKIDGKMFRLFSILLPIGDCSVIVKWRSFSFFSKTLH